MNLIATSTASNLQRAFREYPVIESAHCEVKNHSTIEISEIMVPHRRSTEEYRNLVLTGLMGSGKSTVGPLVAKNLEREFIDTDEYIDEHFGPTASIFKQPDGDIRFRLIEEKVARDLSSRNNLVIATGGRFMINQTNIDTIIENGYVICLTADLNEIVNRLISSSAETFRPRFTKASDKYALMEELRRRSEPYYSQFFQLQTTGSSPSEVARKVYEWFRSDACN